MKVNIFFLTCFDLIVGLKIFFDSVSDKLLVNCRLISCKYDTHECCFFFDLNLFAGVK